MNALEGLARFYKGLPEAGERAEMRRQLRYMESAHRIAASRFAEQGHESEAARNLRAANGLAEFLRATEVAS